MRIVKCANNHYYDETQYSKCPYCENGGVSADDEGKTVGYTDYLNEEKTIAWNGLGTEEDVKKGGGKFNPVVGWLVCVEGAEKGRDYRICSGRNYIGRAANNDICVAEDSSISRERHFSIVYDPRSRNYFALPGDSYTLQVNGEVRTKTYQLSDGDVITCGESKLCFISFCKEGRDWT